ncbi:MAG: glycoside hydrolase family 127 protein [Treponema sp.]|nr:glycoside hydrolase family 127 protein [Treponema sp.]
MNLYLNFPNRHLTDNLQLPKQNEEYKIEWESSNPAFLTADGIINRPESGKKDEKVVLTARIRRKNKKTGQWGQTSHVKFDFLVLANAPFRDLDEISLSDIELSEDYYIKIEKKVIDFLNSFNIDKLLYNFRLNAGYNPDEIPGKSSYAGWENTRIGGHTLGHYLAAAAQAVKKGYANVRGNDGLTFGDRLRCVIEGLYDCQMHNDELCASNLHRKKGFLFGAVMDDSSFPEMQFDKVESDDPSDTWVPWYTMHKILQGLIYVYKFTENTKSFEIALNLSEWVYERVSKWDEKTKNRVLSIEYGGMNDCLYEIYRYAELNGYGKKEHILTAASQFDEISLFEKISASQSDPLNNLHANTTIPKYLGILNRYRLFKEEEKSSKYLDYVIDFWNLVVEKHTYITGGNSECEHFGRDNVLDGKRSNCNCETCNSYNLLKVTKELFKITGEKKYADFYENTFINSILASVNEENGTTTYFQPMATGCFKVFSNPDIDKNYFWCCTGTGFENFTKMGDSFFFKKDDSFYINEYVSSNVYWKEKDLFIHIIADLENSDKIKIQIEKEQNKSDYFSLFLRIPDWVSSQCRHVLTINNKKDTFSQSDGYINLYRKWERGDSVVLNLKKSLKEYTLQDNTGNVFAFKYGPFVLAADLGIPKKKIIRQIGVLCDVCGEKDLWGQTSLLNGNYGGTSNVEILSNEKFSLSQTRDYSSIISQLHFKKRKKSAFYSLNVKNIKGDRLHLDFLPYYRINKSRFGIYWYFDSVVETILNKKSCRIEIEGIGVGYGAQTEGNKTMYPYFMNTGTGSIADSGVLTRYAKENGAFSYCFEISDKYDTYLSCWIMNHETANGLKIESNGTVIGEIEQASVKINQNEKKEYVFKIPETVLKAAEIINSKKVIRIVFSGINNRDSLKVCAPAGTFYFESF